MNESIRDLLRQGADTVERPQLDVSHLVAQAERRLVRRRLAAVATAAVAVTMIVAGGVALRPDDGRPSPAPPVPVKTPETPELLPVPGSTIYFAALANAGDALSGPADTLEDDQDIYLTREGEPVRRIIATKENERCPTVSPDGARLAYTEGGSDRGTDGPVRPTAVVVVPLDSTGDPEPSSRRVIVRDAAGSCPKWSPDGGSLAVIAEGQESDVTELPNELRIVTLDGKERVLALVPGVNVAGDVAWSADGDAVAYLTQDAVWSAPLGGGAPELLWRGTATPDPSPYGLPLPGAPYSMSWSSTGQLAVRVFPDSVVHLVDPDSGNDEVLGTLYDEGDPVWSPDGSRLVFMGDGARIRVYDLANGSTATLRPKLDNVRDLGIYDVAWSPDGDRLLAGAWRRLASSPAVFALVSMATDGTSVEVLTPWTTALYWTYMEDVSWSPR